MSFPAAFSLKLPGWVRRASEECGARVSDEEMAAFAVELAMLNVVKRGGGPFGAAVFEAGSGRLVSAGVNMVVAGGFSAAHAEILAICLAQSALGTHRLDLNPPRSHVLAASAQPCSMCFGALAWSGISRLVCAARRSDVERIAGFDEGPMPRRWIRELGKRGISVGTDVLRKQACEALKAFADSGGKVY